MSPRVIAIDWSGARKRAHKAIWLAEVVDGRLRRLENGRSREEVVRHVIAGAERDPEVVVGLDFAFSFPEWFLTEHGARTGRDAWELAADRGEAWLADCHDPFWGRPGRKRPDLPAHFRRTELEAAEVQGAQPKSVFQIGGAGAVGTGSIRGMRHLSELTDADFSVWPFHEASWPLVIEIYPRLLTGAVVKSDPEARADYLEGAFPEIPEELRATAASSEDALDAAVSAVVMWRHLDEIQGLERPEDEVRRREGMIWWPGEVPRPAPSQEVADCPFCRTALRQTVAASKHGVAIRDAYPVAEGHTLVIARRHVNSIFDLPERERQDLWRLVAEVRARLAHELDCAAFTIGVNDGEAAGQTIAHAHIHVIPRRPGDVDDPRGGVRHVRPDRAAYWD